MAGLRARALKWWAKWDLALVAVGATFLLPAMFETVEVLILVSVVVVALEQRFDLRRKLAAREAAGDALARDLEEALAEIRHLTARQGQLIEGRRSASYQAGRLALAASYWRLRHLQDAPDAHAAAEREQDERERRGPVIPEPR